MNAKCPANEKAVVQLKSTRTVQRFNPKRLLFFLSKLPFSMLLMSSLSMSSSNVFIAVVKLSYGL